MNQFDAILFDLDGVLVDTEALIGVLWQDIFSGHGLELTTAEITRLTSGQTFEGVLHQLETGRGWQAPEDFLPMLEGRFNGAFGHVPQVEGAEQTLSALRAAGLPFAIASNSHKGRLKMKLEGAGLADLVGQHAYDPSCVGGRGKPKPDLYLYAAEQLGVAIHNCLVLEDSVPGASAGVAAGATVWGLLAGAHILPDDEQRLRSAGVARVVHSHAELRGCLNLLRG